jgi:hypothetical protein
MNILDPTLISHVVSTIFASDPPSHKVNNLWPRGQLINFQDNVEDTPYTICSSCVNVEIDQNIYFVESTPLRKMKFECQNAK